MTRRTIELSPELAEAAEWAQERIDRLDFGTVTLTLTMHAGTVAYVDTSESRKRKIAGRPGGHDGRPRS